MFFFFNFFFFQAEDGIRDLVRSRGLGDVYKRQINILFNSKGTKYKTMNLKELNLDEQGKKEYLANEPMLFKRPVIEYGCLLYTSDAADERSSVDLGGSRIIKKKNKSKTR